VSSLQGMTLAKTVWGAAASGDPVHRRVLGLSLVQVPSGGSITCT
jgi:hypothetical protein